MKNRFLKSIRILPLILPIVFILYFFGYMPPKYNVTLYTDNIQGEGLGSVFLSTEEYFSYNYQAHFYFGSQLKHVDILGIHYDVDELSMQFSDVTEADFLGFDVSAFGIPLGHYDFENIAEGDYGPVVASPLEGGKGAHLVFEEPTQETAIAFAFPFIPLWFWISYWVLFLVISLLISFGLSFITDRYPGIRFPLLSISAIAVVMIAGCWFNGSLPYVDYLKFLINLVIVCSVALLINSLMLPFLGTVITMLFTTVWYIANYFVIMYRSKPITPADLKAVGTAREVLGGYTLTPSIQMVIGVILILAYLAAVVVFWHKNHQKDQSKKRMIIKRAVGVLVSIVLLFFSFHNPVYNSLTKFQWDAMLLNNFHKDGMVLTFMKSLSGAQIDRPEGYSKEKANSFLAEYQNYEPETNETRPTNIIMVMNEAFSDLRTVGLDASVDVMPFIDSLDKNAIVGNLFVSVYGGGTCNTEFEALTGNSLAFMNPGAYPYTENVTEPMFSLAKYFADRGYMTNAFHANAATNWNRNKVYPNLGFEKFYSIRDYYDHGDVEELHTHPADIADYRFMEDVSEENKDTPRFLFNVTMQNHSPYDRWEDVEEADSVKDMELGFDGKVYLSLVKASDEAVRQLVKTYQDSEEPTMIILFGDHEPSLTRSTQSQIYTSAGQLNWFQSKFFIWTNYETESVQNATISANYLPWLILERGHFELPPYVQFLADVHEKYPIITSQGIVGADGMTYGTFHDVLDDPLIQKYQYIQYANLIGDLDDGWFTVK